MVFLPAHLGTCLFPSTLPPLPSLHFEICSGTAVVTFSFPSPPFTLVGTGLLLLPCPLFVQMECCLVFHVCVIIRPSLPCVFICYLFPSIFFTYTYCLPTIPLPPYHLHSPTTTIPSILVYILHFPFPYLPQFPYFPSFYSSYPTFYWLCILDIFFVPSPCFPILHWDSPISYTTPCRQGGPFVPGMPFVSLAPSVPVGGLQAVDDFDFPICLLIVLFSLLRPYTFPH